MTRIVVDENRWPIVIITFSGKETRPDIEELISRVDEFRNRNEDFCFVMDLREIGNLDGEVREKVLSWLKSSDMHELAGTAMVVSSSIMRIYLSTMLWLSHYRFGNKSFFKHKTVFSMKDAYEWSRYRLDLHRPGSPRNSDRK